MKHVKKLFAMLMAVMMLVGLLSVTSFAEDPTTYTITAPANDRTYEVYQIFTGDLSGKVLSNVKWGQNGTGTVGEAVPAATLTAVAAISGTDAEKAAALAAYVNLESTAVGTVTNGSTLSVVPGYYLIKDNGPVGDGEAYSLYIVQVVGPTTIQPKVGETTSDKKVDDKNDSNTNEDAINWQDSADYDIGDDVPFRLTATITEKYNDFGKYQLTFHDKESAGLSFQANSVKVYVDNSTEDKIITTEVASSLYSVVTTGLTDGCTFEVRFANLKDIAAVQAGSVIRVEYYSTLNENAKIGAEGNPNTSHITYSNNPNNKQGGEEGKTPDDTVIVFTYQVDVNKIDGEQKPLKGATFELYKKVGGDWVSKGACEAKAVKGEDGETVVSYTASWKGLDDGVYKLSETVTPAGYNTAADIEFTVTAGHVDGDAPYLNTLTVSPNDIFKVVSEITGDVSTPTGYISGDVVNQAGSTLPETGGIGTYIFYAVGGVLVLAAVVLFVTKKRMSNAD